MLMTLVSTYEILLLSLPMCFRCYGSLHRLIMGKVEIGIYFCVTADILTKVLQFLEKSSTNDMNFVQIVNFDWLPWQPKC